MLKTEPLAWSRLLRLTYIKTNSPFPYLGQPSTSSIRFNISSISSLQWHKCKLQSCNTRNTRDEGYFFIRTYEGPPPPSPWPYNNILAWARPLSFNCLTVFITYRQKWEMHITWTSIGIKKVELRKHKSDQRPFSLPFHACSFNLCFTHEGKLCQWKCYKVNTTYVSSICARFVRVSRRKVCETPGERTDWDHSRQMLS